MKNNTSKKSHDVFRSFLVRDAHYTGEIELPSIEPSHAVPKRLLPFSKSLKESDAGAWIHFYEDDEKFERIWNRPQRYLTVLGRFEGVISPDFSLYRDMPLVMQQWNTYRGRAVANWLQGNGIKVIPNVRFSDHRSYGFCCEGIAPSSTVAVGTLGCMQSKEEKEYFIDGLSYVMGRLRPERMIVYGSMPDDVFGAYKDSGTEFLRFESETEQAHGTRSACA